MQKATHINVGLTTTLVSLLTLSQFNIFVIFYVLWSLLPDLDHWQSVLNRKFGIKLPFGHRWFTHTLLFIVLMCWLLNLIAHYAWITLTNKDQILIFILLHSHILADVFTVSSVPYLWPLIKQPIVIPWVSIFKTWTNGEFIFNLIVSIVNLCLVVYVLFGWVLTRMKDSIIQTQHFVSSSSTTLVTTGIIFILLVIYVIWGEIRSTKKYINTIGDTFIGLLSVFLTSVVISGIIGWGIIKTTSFNPQWVILGISTVVIISLLIKLNKHIEFLSKSLGYLLTTFFISFLTLITFNPLNMWNRIIESLEWIRFPEIHTENVSHVIENTQTQIQTSSDRLREKLNNLKK